MRMRGSFAPRLSKPTFAIGTTNRRSLREAFGTIGRVSVPTAHGEARPFHIMPLPLARRSNSGSVSTVTGLSSIDEKLALSVVQTEKKASGRRRRCGTCGLLFPPQDVREEFDEEGRRTGWTCYGCE